MSLDAAVPNRAEGAERLGAVLEAEERLYLELRDLLQRERECMVQLDAEGLEAIVQAKETLADEARLLEDARLAVTRGLARALALPEELPTLGRLCEVLEGAGGRLAERHSRLVALLGAVNELVEANAAFARDGLAQVRDTLRLLGRLLPAEPVYRPGGVAARRGPAGRLVERMA